MDTSSDEPRRSFPDLVIRAARTGDAEEIAALQNLPGFRFGTLRLPYQTPEEVRKPLESRPPASVMIVAVAEGRVVGSGSLERYGGRRVHVANVALGVRDDCVGRGVGTALLRALIDTAENWLAVTRIELTVFVDNLPAIALYRRHGFSIEGTHQAYAFRDGSYVAAHAMARLATASALVPAGPPA
jgi:putative acetyltransferase